jgi:uracil-DNA glycosylase
MTAPIPAGWKDILGDETRQPYFRELQDFLKTERSHYEVYPPEKDVFNALKLTSYSNVRVLLLGQDPYHDVGQAEGLAFSVRLGVPPPPSLLNIFKELHNDTGFTPPGHGHLAYWAEQGVLLLNAVLTVRAHQANSHKGKGWEQFTDSIIRLLSAREQALVFLLWGGYAQKKLELIDSKRHTVLMAAHPSPLSAHRGFFGCRHFSKTNKRLEAWGQEPIDWQLPILESKPKKK